MSSSGYNLNPFPYFPPPSTASYNLPLSLPSLLNCDPSGNNAVFNIHQTHQDPVSFLAPYLPIGHFSTPENVINLSVSNNIQALGNIPDLLAKSAPAGKKDRHSKIYTAQGLRDRRVRLSIDIARKFFDLQDMLGYDKASKTLEWLFSKSRKAIKELSRTKHGHLGFNGTKKVSLVSDVENPEEEEEEEDDEEEVWGLRTKSMSTIDEEIREEERASKVEVFHLLAKESRAKARARARERTMDKKQFSENGHDAKLYSHQKSEEVSDHWKHLDQSTETSNLSMEESSMNTRRIYPKKSIDNAKLCQHHENEISQWKLLDQIKASKGLLQEPPMTKRKWRPSIISGSSQRNLVISIDSIPINLTQNWDSSSNPNYPFAK